METLPNEIILNIAKYLTFIDCFNLAKSSQKYAWLTTDEFVRKSIVVYQLALFRAIMALPRDPIVIY